MAYEILVESSFSEVRAASRDLPELLLTVSRLSEMPRLSASGVFVLVPLSSLTSGRDFPETASF